MDMDNKMPLNFRDAYCQKYGCTPEAFEKRLFWHSLHTLAKPIAPLVLMLNRDFFQPDFEAIKHLGNSTNRLNFVSELDAFFYQNRTSKSAFRGLLKLRISGKKLMAMYQDVWPYRN